MISDFGYIFLFILAGISLVAILLGINKFIRPSRPNPEKMSTYESGEEPTGNANIQFNVRFYIVALVFILFEVELVFLFPWATVFGNEQLYEATNGLWAWISITEMFVFIGMVALGLAYAWIKGYLDWVKPEIKIQKHDSGIPKDAYAKYLT
jgi:NADH-quinone oxidoreductase subunit A